MDNIQLTVDLIKTLCDEKGLSVNDMLIKSGAGARTYHNMKAGSIPSADKLLKIAEFFDISLDYLLGRTDDPKLHKLEDTPFVKP